MAAVEPRARLELTYPDYRSGASPSMLTGLANLEPMERIERSSVAYHATALPLSYIGWSQRGYSKPRPPRYECGAPPLELLRHELLRHGAGAENRTPLTGLAVRCPTNRPHPRKTLERTEIIEISSLGWRPRAHPIYHARTISHFSVNADSIVKDRRPLAYARGSANASLMAKWRGQARWWSDTPLSPRFQGEAS